MMYVLLSSKRWHQTLFASLDSAMPGQWRWVKSKEEFSLQKLKDISPSKIFIPHWSYIIPPEIFDSYECVVFHMTDLPYGRGGSPLQNLIIRGFEETRISAIRVEGGIDTGPVYLKRPLDLCGTAEEIFIRASKIIEDMILEIINTNILPTPQEGEAVVFRRRKPEESNIKQLTDLNQVYDYIRMLDAEGYPKAFIEAGAFRLEFSRATLKGDKSIIADVRISEK